MSAEPRTTVPAAATASGAAPKPTAHPLTNPHYRRLWIGSTISLLGDQFYLVALPWVVLQLTGSAVAMGTILMAAAIPRAVLMLMGGAVTDRLSPRRILMGTASTRTVLVAAISALLWSHTLHVWHLYLLAFGFGLADAFSMPAASAFLPLLVSREQLVAANATNQTSAQLTTIVGPAPAGLVIKSLGAAWAFFLDAISFLFIIAALWSLPDPVRPKTPTRTPLWRSIGEAFRVVRRDEALFALIVLASMLNVCLSGPMSVGLAYLTRTKFGSPAAYGLVVSALAIGGLGGALIAGVWKVRRRGVFLLAACTVIAVALGTMGWLGSLASIAAVLIVMAASAGIANVHIASWVQGRVEPAVRGRVLSMIMLSVVGLAPISLGAAGFLAAWSLTGMFLVASVAMLVATAFGASRAAVRQIA